MTRRRPFLALLAGASTAGCLDAADALGGTETPRPPSFESGPATAVTDPGSPAAEAWPNPRYGAAGTRDGRRVTAPAGKPTRAATLSTAPRRSGATADGEACYFLAGDDEGVDLRATAHDGTERWRTTLERGSIRQIPVVAGPVVVARTAGAVAAYDRDSGDRRWTDESLAGVGQPLAVGSTVYVTAGTTVVAFDAASGERAFTYDPGDPAIDVSAVAVRDGTVYVRTVGMTRRSDHPDTGRLVALDPAAGAERWSITVEDGRGIGVLDGTVLFDDDTVQAFAPRAGEPRWVSGHWASDVAAAPAHDLAVVTGSNGATGQDLATGATRWHQSLDGEERYTLAPAVAGETAVVPVSEAGPERDDPGSGWLRASDVRDGTRRWTVAVDEITAPPIVTDGAVVLTTTTETVAYR